MDRQWIFLSHDLILLIGCLVFMYSFSAYRLPILATYLLQLRWKKMTDKTIGNNHINKNKMPRLTNTPVCHP